MDRIDDLWLFEFDYDRRSDHIMKRAFWVILLIIFGCYNQAYGQDISIKQSVKNANIAWESLFPGKRCVLLHQRNLKYETAVYEMTSLKCDVIKTNSRTNPYKLTVRIEIENWSSKEKKTTINDALANVPKKGEGVQKLGREQFPLTGVYELEDGRWVYSIGNKLMLNFIKRARAKYNAHIDISKILSIPAK